MTAFCQPLEMTVNTVVRMAKVVTIWHWLCVAMSLVFVLANAGFDFETVIFLGIWLSIAYDVSSWLGGILTRHPRLFGFSFMWFDFVLMWVMLSAAGSYHVDKDVNPFSSNLYVVVITACLMVGPMVVVILMDRLTKKSTDLVERG